MKNRVLSVILIIAIPIGFWIIGDFVTNRVLNLGIDRSLGVFGILGILLANEIVGRIFYHTSLWAQIQKSLSDKLVVIISLVYVLVVANLPNFLNIQNHWVNLLFVVLALLGFIPISLLYRKHSNEN